MRVTSKFTIASSAIRAIPIGLLLFLFFLATYSLFIYGSIRFGDEAERYYQARSLVDSHSLVIPLIPGEGITGVDGKPYSQFEMGYGLLVVPFFAFGRVVSTFLSFGDPNWVPVLFVSLSNPVITSLTCLVLFWLARTLGMTRQYAFITTILYGMGTIALPYSRGLYREPTQACTLVGTVFALVRFRHTRDLRWVWIAGTFFGYLALTKVANLFMLPIFLVFLLFVSRGSNQGSRLGRLALHAVAFMIPVGLLLTFQGAVNLVKFGNFFNIGPYNYGNPIPYFSIGKVIQGVSGLLFSPTKSAFLFSPAFALFAPTWFAMLRKQRGEALLVLSLVVGNILFSGLYVYWDGGAYWGPRYLVLITPLMVVPIGVALQEATGRWKNMWMVLTAIALVVGLVVQMLGSLANDREYLDITGRTIDLAGAWDLVRHGSIDSFAFSLSPIDGVRIGAFGWMMGTAAVVLFLGLLAQAGSRDTDVGPSIARTIVGLGGVAILTGVFVVSLVVPFPDALASKANTKYVAANAFFVENRFCHAQSLYALALKDQTNFERESMMRLDEIAPGAQGAIVELGDLTANIISTHPAQVDKDYRMTVSEDGAVRLRAPQGLLVSIETDSDFVAVRADTAYELSGWYRSEGVSESGYGVIGWYEDNAGWQQGRNMEIASFGGTQGWTYFRRTFTTLPTTRRALLKVGMWQTSGTIWVDGIRLVQVEIPAPSPLCSR